MVSTTTKTPWGSLIDVRKVTSIRSGCPCVVVVKSISIFIFFSSVASYHGNGSDQIRSRHLSFSSNIFFLSRKFLFFPSPRSQISTLYPPPFPDTHIYRINTFIIGRLCVLSLPRDTRRKWRRSGGGPKDRQKGVGR